VRKEATSRRHAAMGGIERDHFLAQRLGGRENRRQCVGNWHQCHGVLSSKGLPRLAARSYRPS
jgi:hypothetical protein